MFSTASMVLVVAGLFADSCYGQRRSTVPICDYYAEQLYGSNSSANQARMIERIVSLSYIGNDNLTNSNIIITGNLNQGTFAGQTVDLNYFWNGSIASTNNNGEAAAVDWLDGGGSAPLIEFLNGTTANPTIPTSSNQYQLFQHFFSVFSKIFNCSAPIAAPASTGGPLDLAYVHKFMNLTYNDLGYFIEQLTSAAQVAGNFSAEDATAIKNMLMGQYNNRCAPPPVGSTRLYSLCQDPTCPLAPNPDCAAYVNLSPSGADSAALSSSTSLTISSTSSSPSSPAPSQGSSSTSLSRGGIAGAAIGAAAIAVVAALGFFYLKRKRSHVDPVANLDSRYSVHPSIITPKDNHASYISDITGISPKNQASEMQRVRSTPGSPDLISPYQYQAPVELGTSPMEMASPEQEQYNISAKYQPYQQPAHLEQH